MIMALGLLASALVGVPLFIVLSLAALFAFSAADIEISAVAIEIYRIASAPSILTIPLFTFSGYLLAESGSPKRLLRLAESALGWLPGGVAIVSLCLCAFFTAFTGASGVTIIALGGLLFPILKNEKFSEDFTLGLVTSSGSLGLLFAPSLPLILYGMVASVDINKLFLAGIIPGVFIIAVLSAWSIFKGRGARVKKSFSFPEFTAALKGALPEVLLPIGVLGGVYGGVATVSEIAALTTAYVFIIECFYYKDLNPKKDVPKLVWESMSLVGGILLILCCALGFTSYLVDEQVPMKALAFMRQYIDSKIAFLFFLNIFLLIVGSLMDIFSAIVVVVPLILPIASEFGVDPFHLAIIFLTNLEIGYITPPVGINLFISSFRFKKPVTDLYRASMPFLILLLICLAIITYVPELSLLLL